MITTAIIGGIAIAAVALAGVFGFLVGKRLENKKANKIFAKGIELAQIFTRDKVVSILATVHQALHMDHDILAHQMGLEDTVPCDIKDILVFSIADTIDKGKTGLGVDVFNVAAQMTC